MDETSFSTIKQVFQCAMLLLYCLFLILTINMPEKISFIYDDFCLNFENSPDYVIGYFQQKAIFFNNIKSFRDKEDLRLFIEMICKYVEAIYQKYRYNQAIDLVDQYQTTIDIEIERLKAYELKNEWYYSLQFVKAMAHYELRDYKISTPIFKTLTATDSANDLFKNWLRYSQNAQRLRIINIISIFFLALGVIEIFFKPYIPNYYLRQFVLVFGFIGLVSSLIYESYLRKSLRKKSS